MSIRSQWKGKCPEDTSDNNNNNNFTQLRQQRDTVGENSSYTDVAGDHQSTISHSATLISHPDYSHSKKAAACNDESASVTPSSLGTPRPRDESESQRQRQRTAVPTSDSHDNGSPQSRTWPNMKNAIPPKILSKVAVELENTGSTARDHLANERTWLAYVRTSLAIAGTGVALVQLFTISISQEANSGHGGTGSALQRAARPLGATTVMTGVLVLCVGIFRYFFVQTSLMRNQFPVARTTVIAISVIIAALASVLFGLLIGLKD